MIKIKLFGKKQKTTTEQAGATQTKYQLVTETGNGFFCWNGKVYDSDIVRSCINPKAKAIGKLTAKHIRDSTINPEPYMRFLLESPNPYMSGQQFQEKMCRQVCINSNAFALIYRNEDGYPIALYPIVPVNCEAVYDKQSNLHIKFYLANGKVYEFPYTDILHFRDNYNDNDIFGSPLISALAPLMEVVTTTDQGIVSAIKNSAVIRWLLKFTTAMRPEDLAQQAKNFSENYLKNSSDNLGVAATDSKADAIQVKATDYVPNSAQMNENRKRIMSLFNTNEKIVTSSFNEEEWNAYYEAEVEPFAIDMSNEFTRKLFNRNEISRGNRIILEAANLQYASLSTKINLQSMVDRGALTPNEWRGFMGLAPLPGGDTAIRRLDTDIVEEVTNE